MEKDSQRITKIKPFVNSWERRKILLEKIEEN